MAAKIARMELSSRRASSPLSLGEDRRFVTSLSSESVNLSDAEADPSGDFKHSTLFVYPTLVRVNASGELVGDVHAHMWTHTARRKRRTAALAVLRKVLRVTRDSSEYVRLHNRAGLFFMGPIAGTTIAVASCDVDPVALPPTDQHGHTQRLSIVFGRADLPSHSMDVRGSTSGRAHVAPSPAAAHVRESDNRSGLRASGAEQAASVGALREASSIESVSLGFGAPEDDLHLSGQRALQVEGELIDAEAASDDEPEWSFPEGPDSLCANDEDWLEITLQCDGGDSVRYFPRSRVRLPIVRPHGISVVSDIDDTIKLSFISDKRVMMRQGLLEEYIPVPDMATMYRSWERKLGAKFHYVSNGPWQLWPPLCEFLYGHQFPVHSAHLREFSFRNATDLLENPADRKVTVMEPLFALFPERKFVLVGDCGEQDPEAYGYMARAYPSQVIAVCIRRVLHASDFMASTDFSASMDKLNAAAGAAEAAEAARLDAAFAGVDRSKTWVCVFDDASDLADLTAWITEHHRSSVFPAVSAPENAE